MGPPRMEPDGTQTPQSLRVGPDLVTVEGDALVIYARRPIADWRIREFHKQPIFFQDEKYYLRDKRPATGPFAIRYELVPWPADLHEESSRRFVYDEALVAERDREARTDRQRTTVYYILLPFYPVLGFCWSGFKERVLWPLGFEPSGISSAATMLGFGFSLVDGILFGYLQGGIFYQLAYLGAVPFEVTYGTARIVDAVLLALVVLDCAVRFNQQLRGDIVPGGFLEWLFPFGRKG